MQWFIKLPYWAHMFAGGFIGVALFIALTSDNPDEWWSAHQLGKRDNIAYLILAIAGLATLYGIVPLFINMDRIIINFGPYWVAIKSYLPYFILGLIVFILSLAYIKRRKK